MRTDEQWLAELQPSHPNHAQALADLHAHILRTLPYGLNRFLSPQNPHFHSLVEETAQETLLRVLAHKDSFAFRSRFTTWVNKIAVHIALSELRRKRWQDRSLDALLDEQEGRPAPVQLMTDRRSSAPEAHAAQKDLLRIVMQAIQDELSERQRTVLTLVAFENVPLDVVAERMDTNRNALYKLLHDARRKLKRRLTRDGLPPEDILAAFER